MSWTVVQDILVKFFRWYILKKLRCSDKKCPDCGAFFVGTKRLFDFCCTACGFDFLLDLFGFVFLDVLLDRLRSTINQIFRFLEA